VVDLLDYDVRFGQGFLFAPPRPLRPEGASSAAAPASNGAQANGSGQTGGIVSGAIEPPPRSTGKAARARPAPAARPDRRR
jgi:cyclic-di-GMP phosphodiesterase TipF (flagellum assembly factor)